MIFVIIPMQIDGRTYDASNTFTNLSPRYYTIYVKDSNDCGATFQAEVIINTQNRCNINSTCVPTNTSFSCVCKDEVSCGRIFLLLFYY